MKEKLIFVSTDLTFLKEQLNEKYILQCFLTIQHYMVGGEGREIGRVFLFSRKSEVEILSMKGIDM